MNCVIWVIACNRLFVLMSPLGGLPSVHMQTPFGAAFLRGIPESPDPDEQNTGPWPELKSVA